MNIELIQMLLIDLRFHQLNFVKLFSVCNNIKYLLVISDYLRNIIMTLRTCMIKQLSGQFFRVMFHRIKLIVREKFRQIEKKSLF